MKKIYVLFTGLALLFQASLLRADEGMWLPMLVEKLNIGTMTKLGLKLSAEDIYSINQACLKDAIVALDYGSCSAEVISKEGLLLTNHHCGYGEIQAHSTVEHDYLTNGFWAMTKEEELPNPGKVATFLIRAEDITNKVLAVVDNKMDESQRLAAIDSICKVITEAKSKTNYRRRVQSMLKGNQFILFVYEDFKDVRLVGAPPESIGKFGSDTDNWMWPRHTGDFSIFRVYCGPDGKPAAYSKDNIPYKPKSHLKISLDGVKEGDYAMIMGYPGSTQRYMTSWGVQNTMKYTNEYRYKVREIKQNIWKEAMDANDATRIKYASKYARSANYWKYSIGQNKGLKALDVVRKKQKLEAEFTKWVNANNNRKAKYGEALSLIKNYLTTNAKTKGDITVLYETLLGGTEALLFAYRLGSDPEKVLSINADSTEYIQKFQTRSKSYAAEFFKDYDANLDKKVMKAMIKTFMEMVDKDKYPKFITKEIGEISKIDKWVNNLFKKTVFTDLDKTNAFIENPNLKVLKKDPAFIAGKQIINAYRSISGSMFKQEKNISKGERLFVAGLMEMNPNKSYYPNANSSMRLTYGTIGGYAPKDAVEYKYYTTLDGLMEKEDANVREFNVKPRLKELYNKKDYGRYANENGDLVVAFLSNNDITGGNSGSAVMNAKGELIGIAFDGNWEAMSGDIAFEPKLQRTISVDIRYVLFVIDKFAGAKNLINEMTIVKN